MSKNAESGIMGLTEDQVRELIEKENKRKERQRIQTKRQLVKTRLYVRKAKEAGIEVTEEEIMAEINK